ncbi:MAG: hypothetical protein JNM94_18710 [Phycisphaerae bacterium]|nr:hypothetical protein [Phycisphaerae bacterium]
MVVVLLTFMWLAAQLAGSAPIGALAGAALFATLHRFFLPVRCSIDRENAMVRTTLRTRTLPVASVRRVAHDGKAILLTPRIDDSVAAIARGLVMPLPAEDGMRVVDEVRARLGGAAPSRGVA